MGMADLNTYNGLVLACQDEAFTLAAYLLGDDRAADAAVQEAVVRAYRRYLRTPEASVRLLILQQVLACCGRSARARGAGPVEGFCDPAPRERTTLLLVDVLGLSYDEAAEVLGCSRDQVVRRLARARVRIAERVRQRGVAHPVSVG